MSLADAASAPPLIAVLAPFIAAIGFLVLSPLLTDRAKKQVNDQINRDCIAEGQPIVNDMFDAQVSHDGHDLVTKVTVPAAIRPTVIGDYIEHAADLVSFLPTALLPVVGAIFALTTDIAKGTALDLLLLSVFLAVVGDLWLSTRSAQRYASWKLLTLSAASVVGVVANAASIALIIWAT